MALDRHEPEGPPIMVRMLLPAGRRKAAVELVERCRVLRQTLPQALDDPWYRHGFLRLWAGICQPDDGQSQRIRG
jgi:hypothetical protein